LNVLGQRILGSKSEITAICKLYFWK